MSEADHYDVIVAGGGASGLIAAVASAREGRRTLLVERSGFMGGTATNAYVAQWVGFYNGATQAVWGYPYELTCRVDAAGGGNGFDSYTMGEAAGNPLTIRNYPFNPEIVKIVADEIIDDAGAEALLHTQIADVLRNDGRVSGIVVENVAGRKELEASVVVDATGDAVVAKAAGVGIRGEEDELRRARQPQSFLFRLSDVDLPRFRAIPSSEKRALALEGLKNGELFWESMSIIGVPGTRDVVCFMSRIQGFDALDDADLSAIEREGRRQVKSIWGFLRRRVPGFGSSQLSGMATRAGIRETRRIVGQYTLEEEDIAEDRRFPDAVALGAGPVDLHDAKSAGIHLTMPPAPFEVPMRCLLPEEVEGLVVTGRAISATREANGGARHMATAMALGQAAGTMAAVASETGSTLGVSAEEVRKRLRAGGAAISAEDCARFERARAAATA